MTLDPFAGVSALRSLQAFLDDLTREFREKRKPFDESITSLLLAWDCGFSAEALAPLFEDASAAAIAAKCPPGCTSGTGFPAALASALLSADGSGALTLLNKLFSEHPAEAPAVRAALERHAERVLSAWCVRHAADFPARLKAEAERLGVDPAALSEWCHRPQPDDVAAALVFAAEYRQPFAVGLLYDAPHLDATAPVGGEPDPADDAAKPVEMKPTPKRRIPAAEANVLVREYLAAHARANPDAMTVRGIAKVIGASEGGVSESDAWRTFSEARQKLRPGSVRTVRLTDTMLSAIPDRDELARLIADHEDDDRADDDRDRDDDAPRRRKR